jgi:hypothetical protein
LQSSDQGRVFCLIIGSYTEVPLLFDGRLAITSDDEPEGSRTWITSGSSIEMDYSSDLISSKIST